eukprot:8024269-Karenia_brevis.AAC.1
MDEVYDAIVAEGGNDVPVDRIAQLTGHTIQEVEKALKAWQEFNVICREGGGEGRVGLTIPYNCMGSEPVPIKHH